MFPPIEQRFRHKMERWNITSPFPRILVDRLLTLKSRLRTLVNPRVLAAVASQALDVTGRAAPPPLTGFLDEVRGHFPPVRDRRVLGEDAARLAAAFTRRAEGSEEA